MRIRARELVADWLIVAGAVSLFVSLFLTWSHQFSPALEQGAALPPGMPRDPTAWQVYSVADVGLALLAAVLFLIALVGGWRARMGALVPVGIALAFTAHAQSVPPTNGANIANPALSVPQYLPRSASPGAGETVAIAALAVAAAGLGLSFERPLSSK